MIHKPTSLKVHVFVFSVDGLSWLGNQEDDPDAEKSHKHNTGRVQGLYFSEAI